MIELTIKTLDSNNHTIRVDDDTTVYGLKQKVLEQLGIDIEQQRLIFFGRVLHDNKKLAEYGVHGKVVHLVERPPPRFAQSSNEDEEMEGRRQPIDANYGRSNRALSPTRARIEFLQRSIQEIRSLMESLRNLQPEINLNQGPSTASSSRRRPQYHPSTSQAGPSNEELSHAGPSQAGTSAASSGNSTSHDGDDPERVTITDRLGRVFEPRVVVPYTQRYAGLLNELMELESQFHQYRTMYIDWIRQTDTSTSSAEVPNEEVEETIRRKQQFSTVVSEIHHGFAHAHHVISDINFLVTPSNNRLTSDTIIPNNTEIAMHAHLNMMHAFANEWDGHDPNQEDGRQQHLPHQRLYRRHHRLQQQPQLASQHQQQSQRSQPQRGHVHMQSVGFQMTRNPCRLHAPRSAMPSQQPQYPAQQPQMPNQQPQMPNQQPQMPNQQPQMPTQQPQYQPAAEIIMQQVAPGIHAPILLGTPATLNINMQPNPVTFQLELETRSLENALLRTVANHVSQLAASQAAEEASNDRTAPNDQGISNNTTSTTGSGATQTQSNPRTGTQPQMTPPVLGPNLGTVHLGTFNLGTINLGTISAVGGMDIDPQSGPQGPANSDSGGQGTNQNANNQSNQDNINQTSRPRQLFDFESLLRGLNQDDNVGDMEIVMSLEAPNPEDDMANAFAINNPHLHSSMLAAAANVLSNQRPNGPNVPVSSAAAHAAARLAAAEAAAAAARLAAAEAAAAEAAAAAARASAAEAAEAEAASPSAPTEPRSPGNAAPNQQPRRPTVFTRTRTTVQPTSLYIYDTFLLCHSSHARRQLTRRRQKWETARQARQERVANDARRREMRESRYATENQEAVNALVRVNRPSVFSESVMVAILVSMHEATAPDNFVTLSAEEFENLRRVLLIGLRRLSFMCENESMPVTATRLAGNILRHHSAFIDRMDVISRLRPSSDGFGSLRCLIATYMPAICAVLQRASCPSFVASYRQLFSNLFYDLACLLVHICRDGYEGFSLIYNAFMDDLLRSMDMQSNSTHVLSLARSMLNRVVDHIETNPSDPHQYVVRTDRLTSCICHGDSQSRPGHRPPQRDVPIVIHDDDPVEAPSYPAPRVVSTPGTTDSKQQGDTATKMTMDSEMRDPSFDEEEYTTDEEEQTPDVGSRLRIDTEQLAMSAEVPSDDDSDAYVSPIVVPGASTYTRQSEAETTEPTAEQETRENSERMTLTQDNYSIVQSTDEFQDAADVPAGNVHKDYSLPEREYSQGASESRYVRLGSDRESRSSEPLVGEREYSPHRVPEKHASRAPDKEQAAHASECVPRRPEQNPSTSLHPVISLPPPPPPSPRQGRQERGAGAGSTEMSPDSDTSPRHDTASPANKRMRQESATEAGASAKRKVTLHPESKRKFPTIRCERAPNPNEPSSSEDSAESVRRNRVEHFARQWVSVLEADARVADPPTPLSDAYLAGMTPRRRRRVRNARPPQDAVAFIHDCVTSASQSAVEGGEAESAVFSTFYEYFRTLAAERAASSEDYQPALHMAVAKLLSRSSSQED